eukprot:s76_g3.t1
MRMAALLMLTALQLAAETKEHLTMERSWCPKLLFPISTMTWGDSKGINSKAFKSCDRTLEPAVGFAAAESKVVAEANDTWGRSTTMDLVRGQGNDGSGEVQGFSGILQSCAISACVSMEVQGLRNYSSLLWKTPKELSEGATLVQQTQEPTSSAVVMDGNLDEGCLATLNSASYEIDFNLTQEVEPIYTGGMAMVYMPYVPNYLNKLDATVERMFLFLEGFNISMACVEWFQCLWCGMRQMMELMSVERTWTCWLSAIVMLLAWSHLGPRNWSRTTSWSSATQSTRLDKHKMRRRRVEVRLQLRAMLFISLVPCCQGMETGGGAGAGEQAFLQQMSMLASAATNAANAAEKAIGLLSQGASSSSDAPGGDGLQAAARILKNPEVYTGDDPIAFPGWKFAFCSWLGFGDPRYQKCFDNLEKLSPSDDIPDYTEVEAELSMKLFAILASYLRGRCTGLVKSMAKQKDGFRLWRSLMQEFEPTSRQRSLALAQTLSNYPVFTNNKGIMEQILSYEQSVQQFEEVSSSTYPAELKIATLVRCSHQKLRDHLQLTIGEKTTYSQLKEVMLGYDKACRSWTSESVLKSLQHSTPADAGGPQPMEVDRIENKGKGKSKSKSKDKGKNWWSYGAAGGESFGRGRGRGKGRSNKGKGKGKQKGKSKNKGKDFGKKGKTKGKIDSQQC